MKVLLIVLISAVSASTFATSDQHKVVYDCTSAVPHPDAGLSIQLLNDSSTDGATVRVSRMILHHHKIHNYLVEKQKSAGRMGAAQVYTGQGVTFTINITTAPLEDGRRVAVFESKDNGKENLKCELK